MQFQRPLHELHVQRNVEFVSENCYQNFILGERPHRDIGLPADSKYRLGPIHPASHAVDHDRGAEERILAKTPRTARHRLLSVVAISLLHQEGPRGRGIL